MLQIIALVTHSKREIEVNPNSFIVWKSAQVAYHNLNLNCGRWKIYTTVVQPGFLENIFLHFKASDQLRSTTYKKKKKKSKRIELKKPKIRFYELTVNNVVLSPTSPLATASIQQRVGKAGSRYQMQYNILLPSLPLPLQKLPTQE